MLYTLILIDIQDVFLNYDTDSLILECLNEVENAKNLGYPIILLEYMGKGRSTKEILDAVSNYKNLYSVGKSTDDGSKEIMNVIYRFGLPKNNIVVCGGRTDCCVSSTVFGLVDYYLIMGNTDYTINVIEPACYAETNERHRDGLSNMISKGNIKIITG